MEPDQITLIFPVHSFIMAYGHMDLHGLENTLADDRTYVTIKIHECGSD